MKHPQTLKWDGKNLERFKTFLPEKFKVFSYGPGPGIVDDVLIIDSPHEGQKGVSNGALVTLIGERIIISEEVK